MRQGGQTVVVGVGLPDQLERPLTDPLDEVDVRVADARPWANFRLELDRLVLLHALGTLELDIHLCLFALIRGALALGVVAEVDQVVVVVVPPVAALGEGLIRLLAVDQLLADNVVRDDVDSGSAIENVDARVACEPVSSPAPATRRS